MPLYHFSEDPDIRRFEPRVPERRRGELEPLVWAIDEWHQPLYFFPRDCPRILVWPLPTTTAEDHMRWFGSSEARMLAHIEWTWLERMQTTRLYRYILPDADFDDLGDAGVWVSRTAIEPKAVEPVGDLFAALRAEGIELRILDRLTPLRGVWNTTLHASGIRLRHAAGWEQ